jgi:hypothetical protein
LSPSSTATSQGACHREAASGEQQRRRQQHPGQPEIDPAAGAGPGEHRRHRPGHNGVLDPQILPDQHCRQGPACGKREEDAAELDPEGGCEDRLRRHRKHEQRRRVAPGIDTAQQVADENEAEQRKGDPAEPPQQRQGRAEQRRVDVVAEHESRRHGLDRVERAPGQPVGPPAGTQILDDGACPLGPAATRAIQGASAQGQSVPGPAFSLELGPGRGIRRRRAARGRDPGPRTRPTLDRRAERLHDERPFTGELA